MTHSHGNGNAYDAYRRSNANGARLPPTPPNTVRAAGGGKKKKPQVMTLRQQLDIGARLDQVCDKPTDDFPYAKYKDGFSDEAIAAEFGCTPYAVGRVRMSAIGKLQQGSGLIKNNAPALAVRIAAIEAALAAIEVAVASLQARASLTITA